MKHANARFEIERAPIYLQQLCKHFAHKLRVQFTPAQGRIDFSIGTCRLAARDRVLTLDAEGADEGNLTLLQGMVDRHLLRFVFGEEMKIDWRRT